MLRRWDHLNLDDIACEFERGLQSQPISQYLIKLKTVTHCQKSVPSLLLVEMSVSFEIAVPLAVADLLVQEI